MKLSARAAALQPSLTLAISAKAKALQADGQDICSLSAGEPDFETPAFIRAAASAALEAGHTRYGMAAGELPLRLAIAAGLSDSGMAVGPDQVLVTNGGKQALYNLFQVLLDPGDEVLLPAPFWLSYPEMVQLAGAVVKVLPSDAASGFRLDLQALEALITPRSRLLILNTPTNPTGAVLQKQELEAVAELLRRHPQLAVVCDEIYEHLLAEGEQHHRLACLAPDLADRLFLVNGFAKGWAMTGWRIGYMVGPRAVVKAAVALQSQSTSNVCTFAQYGALAALQGPMQSVQAMAASFSQRRKQLSDGLRQLPGLVLVPPKGAFYAFPDVGSYGLGSVGFCEKLLEQEGLALVPGAAFGDDRCVRLSCAVSSATIDEGLGRLSRFLQKLAQ
jgi:aspartate aminotransferase